MPYTKNSSTRLYYEVHGEGPALVLISGLGGDSNFWGDTVARLQSQFQVIVFDNRGIGRSDAPDAPYSMEMFADDLADLLEEIGVTSTHVLGFSMGGNIAQAFALKYPHKVRKLILAATFATMGSQVRLFLDAVLSVYETGATGRQMYYLILPWLFSAKFLETPGSTPFMEYDEADPHQQPLYAFRRQYEAQRKFDRRENLPQISMPTLVLAGEQDVLAPLSASHMIQQGIPGARLEVFKGAGHLFNVEQPKQFHQQIVDFLKQ